MRSNNANPRAPGCVPNVSRVVVRSGEGPGGRHSRGPGADGCAPGLRGRLRSDAQMGAICATSVTGPRLPSGCPSARRRGDDGSREPAAALGRHRGRRGPLGRPRPGPSTRPDLSRPAPARTRTRRRMTRRPKASTSSRTCRKPRSSRSSDGGRAGAADRDRAAPLLRHRGRAAVPAGHGGARCRRRRAGADRFAGGAVAALVAAVVALVLGPAQTGQVSWRQAASQNIHS